MKKQHYKWWGYIKAIIQEYPRSRSSELTGVEIREHEAVKKAVDETMKMDGGANRLKVISMVHWERTRTLGGAALAVPCGNRTAAYWQREFFEETARNRDVMDRAIVETIKASWIPAGEHQKACPFCLERVGRANPFRFCPWCGERINSEDP